jgi:hypothetical protein
MMRACYRISALTALLMLCIVSCIEPPLHLPGQNLEMMIPQVETEIEVVWDIDVDFTTDWYYGWDVKDDSLWGNIGYTRPTGYEVHRYYKGDKPRRKHLSDDAFSIRSNRFRRYFQFGYYDMLFYSEIDSKDGTQVVVMHETLDSVTATTTGTRGLSKGILDMTRAGTSQDDGAIGLLNQPEIFYGAYPEDIYISYNLDDYDYDPVENIYIKHLETKLRPLVYIYLVQLILCNNDDGKIKGINGNSALSSMASSTNVNTGHTGNSPAVIYFNTRMKKDLTVKGRKSDVIGGKLTTFGLCDNEPYVRSKAQYAGSRTTLKNYLYFDLIWNNGGVKTYQFDVTDQCHAQAHGGILTVWIDCSELTPPDPGPSSKGSLFIPTVEDYDEVVWEIEI